MSPAARIALVFWDGYLGVAPSMIAAIDAMSAHGFEVDVILRAPHPSMHFAPPPKFDARVKILEMPQRVPHGTDMRWANATLLQRIRLLPLKLRKRSAQHLDRLRFRRLVAERFAQRAYDVIIAVDDDSIAAAGPVATRHGVPLVYWSLEIDQPPPDADPVHRAVRRSARRYRELAAFVIVQDPSRAHALGVSAASAQPVHFVPNAPAGVPVDMRSRFFHERFALPADQKIILHAGGMLDETLVHDIAAAAASWPADWTLVLHEREGQDPDGPLVRGLEALGKGRVRCSVKPVSYRELDTLFAGADVSLALYSAEHGENWSLIAYASGKLAHSLRVGVPVVCSDLPGLHELMERTRCGLAVPDCSHAGDAIRAILADAPGYRERAFKCYREEFEFSAHFTSVLRDLEQLSARKWDR